jgi:hypothetical protein
MKTSAGAAAGASAAGASAAGASAAGACAAGLLLQPAKTAIHKSIAKITTKVFFIILLSSLFIAFY